ncbi:MAG: hypothetical protein ACRCYU_12160 [Nocardioides sp.]
MPPGPIPNRSDNLSRDRDANRGDRPPISQGEARPVTIPNAGRDWHPIAKRLWQAMKDSGQADFYQDSDWAYAFHVMDELSDYKFGSKRSSMMFAAIDAAMTKLLITEGDRRRARIELQAPEDPTPSAAVVAIEDYRRELGVVPDDEEDD